jgi:hypothetical protein
MYAREMKEQSNIYLTFFVTFVLSFILENRDASDIDLAGYPASLKARYHGKVGQDTGTRYLLSDKVGTGTGYLTQHRNFLQNINARRYLYHILRNQT